VDNKHIKEILLNTTVTPPLRAWDKVVDKMDTAMIEKRLKRKKILSYFINAAVFILLIGSCIFIYQESSVNHKMKMGNIAAWEELDITNDNFYDVKKVRKLTTAYSQAGNPI